MPTLSLSLLLVFAAPPPKDPFVHLSAAQQKQCKEQAPATISGLVSIDGEQAKRLTELAFTSKKAIVMRPIGSGAPKWRSENSSPKPLAIKWKTCNEVDMQIGAPADCFGALVLFQPHQPVTWPTDEVKRSIMENRIKQRAREWSDAHNDHSVDWSIPNYVRFYDMYACDELHKLAPGCMVLVGFRRKDGFVRDVKNNLPFTGDLDLFDITRSDGGHLKGTDKGKQQLVLQLIAEEGVDVLHPAHVDWDTSKYRVENPEKYAYLENIRLPILDVHRERPQSSPKREPLVMVRPDCSVCEVWAQPHKDDPYAKVGEKAKDAWKYPCITTPSKQIDRNSPRAPNWNPEKPNEPPPNLDHIPLAPLKYKKGQKLYVRPLWNSPDEACAAVTIKQAARQHDGTGVYSYKLAKGEYASEEAAYFESLVCDGPPPSQSSPPPSQPSQPSQPTQPNQPNQPPASSPPNSPPPPASSPPASPAPPASKPPSQPPKPPGPKARLPVGAKLKIKPGPSSPNSDCFAITITSVQKYDDGTAAYEFKNSGGGVSGDDADSLEARRCK